MVGQPPAATPNRKTPFPRSSEPQPTRPAVATIDPGARCDPVALGEALRNAVIPAVVARRRRSARAAVNGHAALPAVKPAVARLVARLVALVVHPDDRAAARFVARVRLAGLPLERISSDLLEPAARELGERWCADRLDFTQVTIGVWRLQRIAHEVDGLMGAVGQGGIDLSALLAATPGEQHTFGLFTVGACFRRAGWSVVSDEPSSLASLVQHVQRRRFALVGLSLGSERGLDTIRTVIREVRRASCNPGLGILVGGPVFLDKPAMVHDVGGDVTARDGPEAVHVAGRFLERTAKT